MHVIANRKMSLVLIVILTVLAVWLATRPDVAFGRGVKGKVFPPRGTVWGEAKELGEGKVQTFVRLTPKGKPLFVGVYLTAAAFDGLPDEISDGSWDIVDPDTGEVVWYCCGHETLLDFPEKTAAAIPFEFFVLNWNPHGHIPPGIYHLPHFDFHFYTISNAERAEIEAPDSPAEMCVIAQPDGSMGPVPLTCELYERAVAPLPADEQPPQHINVNAVEPGMGNHLIDLSSPEFTGGIFTHTWIYGAFDGKLIFHEPMITVAFFEEKHEEVCMALATPQAMSSAGYYPTEYCMRYLGNQDAYAVTLEAFRWFEASDGIVE